MNNLKVNIFYRSTCRTLQRGYITFGRIKVYFRRYGGINKWNFWKYNNAGKQINLYTTSIKTGLDIIESLKRNANNGGDLLNNLTVKLFYRSTCRIIKGGYITFGRIKVYFRRYGGINKWNFWKYNNAGKRINLYTTSIKRGLDIIKSLKNNSLQQRYTFGRATNG